VAAPPVSSHSSPRRCSLCSADAPRRSAALCRATGSADAPPVGRARALSLLGSFDLGALRGRSGRPPLCSRACGSLHSSTPIAHRGGSSSYNRPSAARHQRSAQDAATRSAFLPRSHDPVCARVGAALQPTGYSALPLPKPRRGHAHSLTASFVEAVPKTSHQGGVPGGVASISSAWGPAAADLPALTAADFGRCG
jgi:hypothetical protein